jgi:protein-disulfide isomerase
MAFLQDQTNRLIVPISYRDHCLGNSTARITLVEYGDYRCPKCLAAQRIVPFLQQQLGEQIWFVFRHFPQLHLYPESFHAAEAAEAAASQNKFWEMHTHLFEHQSHLADHYLVEYAIALQLDVNQFLAEMASDRHVARVQADIESGIQSGVTQTPTFFVNNLRCNDNQSLETLLMTISQANPLEKQ